MWPSFPATEAAATPQYIPEISETSKIVHFPGYVSLLLGGISEAFILVMEYIQYCELINNAPAGDTSECH